MKQLSARSQRQLESARKDCLAFVQDNEISMQGYGLLQALAQDALDKGYRYQIAGYARIYLSIRSTATTNEELKALLVERNNMYLALSLEV